MRFRQKGLRIPILNGWPRDKENRTSAHHANRPSGQINHNLSTTRVKRLTEGRCLSLAFHPPKIKELDSIVHVMIDGRAVRYVKLELRLTPRPRQQLSYGSLEVAEMRHRACGYRSDISGSRLNCQERAMKRESGRIVRTAIQARGAVRGFRVRYVLVTTTGLVVAGFVIIYLFYFAV